VLLAPAGLPRPILDRLNQEMHSALANPQLVEGFAKVGAEPRFTAPAETGQFLGAELDKWLGIVRAAKIELN
jgi:tripartite-type tricarboxylate transporter receptor subunit TctC